MLHGKQSTQPVSMDEEDSDTGELGASEQSLLPSSRSSPAKGHEPAWVQPMREHGQTFDLKQIEGARLFLTRS